MKRLTYLATALLVIAGAVSCKKNSDVQDPEPQPSGRMVPFSVSTGQSSQKTSVIGGVLSWSKGDKITVVQKDGQYPTEPLTLTAGAGTAEGSFSGEISADVQDGASLVGLYNATYSYNSGVTTYSASIPATQTYTEGSFQPGIYPSIGTGTYVKGGVTNINFATSIFGILRVAVKGGSSGDKLSSITLESLDSDKKLSGEFSLIKMGETTDFGGGTGDKITMNCGDISFSGDGVQLNFVVPTFTFASGDLKVTVTNSKGVSYYLTYSSAVAISANNVTKIDADITTSIAGNATITGGVKVEWVQLWADGPKWAEYNVGAENASEYGGYYCWGGSYKNGNGIAWVDDHNTGFSSLSGDSDTATKLWGSNWQMPTKADFDNVGQCTIAWITEGDKNVLRATGKGDYSANMVIFPIAGRCYKDVSDTGNGFYWSSDNTSTVYNEGAYGFYLTPQFLSIYTAKLIRLSGQFVRAILHEE